ncbi:hypothetical protein ACJX0J_020081, partial [Zea mays]
NLHEETSMARPKGIVNYDFFHFLTIWFVAVFVLAVSNLHQETSMARPKGVFSIINIGGLLQYRTSIYGCQFSYVVILFRLIDLIKKMDMTLIFAIDIDVPHLPFAPVMETNSHGCNWLTALLYFKNILVIINILYPFLLADYKSI